MKVSSLVPAILCFLSACDRAAQPSTASHRDSADITIVENVEPIWDDQTTWHVSVDPLLSLGIVSGDTNYELHDVRGVARLSNGTVVVANNGSRELRWYASNGLHLRSVGREGGGAGEFQWLNGLSGLPADSVAAFDSRLKRVSIFSRGGEFVRSFQYHSPGAAQGIFSDGSLLTIAMDGIPPGGPSGIRELNLRTYRYRPRGEIRDSVGTFPAAVTYQSGRVGGIQGSPIPFMPRASVALAEDRFYVVTGELYDVQAYSPLGRLRTIWRIARRPHGVTASDIAEFKERTLARYPDARSSAFPSHARLLDELPYPSTMPTYDDVLVDAAGNVWTRHYAGPRQIPGFRGSIPCDSCWTVFDPDGRWLGNVGVPESLEVMQIGDDYVAGVWRDELNVEFVRIHALAKPMQ